MKRKKTFVTQELNLILIYAYLYMYIYDDDDCTKIFNVIL